MSYEKEGFLALIRSNINEYRFHFTIVQQAVEPRYAYTIGCYGVFGFEMILAGGIFYLRDDLSVIFKRLFDFFKNGGSVQGEMDIENLGTFKFRLIDDSWKEAMSLGAIEQFEGKIVDIYQILPDVNHFTLDIPNMSEMWTVNDPIWKWLKIKWSYGTPDDSLVTTNLDALLGKPVTEVIRWEADDWEMFAGKGRTKKEIRVVPLGLMIGIDPTLLPSIDLEIEEGIRRESRKTAWQKW